MQRFNLKMKKKNRPNKSFSLNKNEINFECEKLFKITSSQLPANQLWDNYLEISNILTNIMNLENSTTNAYERLNNVENFVNWLKQNKAKIDGVSIYRFPGYGLGLKAEVEFNENDLILEIPKDLIFNIYTAAAEIKDLEADIIIQNLPQVALAIALLIEKNKSDSKWKPYINILPQAYSTILYMSVDDMNELKGTSVLEHTLKQYRNIARQYSYFHKLFQNTQNSVCKLLRNKFTYNEYRWAVSTIMTRQNIIPMEHNSKFINSLIPFWDLCNHEEGKITTDFDTQVNSCKCYAMRKFSIGEQIFIYYGSRTNTELFIYSGFIYSKNKSDGVHLRLGISKADPLYRERSELLCKIGVPITGEYLLKPVSHPITGSLLGFLRVFNMDKNEISHWLKSNDVLNLITNDLVSEETVDKKVLKFITVRLKLLLTNYTSPKKEIDKKMCETILRDTQKMSLNMKLIEKRILQDLLEILQSNMDN